MHHKLTITVDEQVYKGLHKIIGRGNISRFVEDLVRPHLEKRKARSRRPTEAALIAGYKAMAADKEREKEAKEWIESNISDGLDELPDETW
ncbi:MAG: addiction module antitoxin [Alphaproteobacteria bacterium]|nr:addiction module antitoxin [Alphaproteobacteria bacterium]